jgi:hypothetical protein
VCAMQRRTREILVFHVPHDGDVHMNYAFLVFHYQPGGKAVQKINPDSNLLLFPFSL